MKNVTLLVFAICVVLSACNQTDLDKQEAIRLIRQDKHYPKVVDYDIYCSDPTFAKKVLDAGLEKQALVKVQRTQKLGNIGKPIIQFTDKADPYLLPTPSKDKAIHIQRVKLADEELRKITDIKILNNGKNAIADYTTSYDSITPFSILVHTAFKKEANHTAYFALGSGGWKLEKK